MSPRGFPATGEVAEDSGESQPAREAGGVEADGHEANVPKVFAGLLEGRGGQRSGEVKRKSLARQQHRVPVHAAHGVTEVVLETPMIIEDSILPERLPLGVGQV